MIPALIVEALRDRLVRGQPFAVLCYLHSTLELGEYRPVKHWVVAQDIGVSRQKVSRAMRLLVEHGYLRAGIKTERNVGSYMLLASRGHSIRQTA